MLQIWNLSKRYIDSPYDVISVLPNEIAFDGRSEIKLSKMQRFCSFAFGKYIDVVLLAWLWINSDFWYSAQSFRRTNTHTRTHTILMVANIYCSINKVSTRKSMNFSAKHILSKMGAIKLSCCCWTSHRNMYIYGYKLVKLCLLRANSFCH